MYSTAVQHNDGWYVVSMQYTVWYTSHCPGLHSARCGARWWWWPGGVSGPEDDGVQHEAHEVDGEAEEDAVLIVVLHDRPHEGEQEQQVVHQHRLVSPAPCNMSHIISSDDGTSSEFWHRYVNYEHKLFAQYLEMAPKSLKLGWFSAKIFTDRF